MTKAEEQAMQAQREASIVQALDYLEAVARTTMEAVESVRATLPPDLRAQSRRVVLTLEDHRADE